MKTQNLLNESEPNTLTMDVKYHYKYIPRTYNFFFSIFFSIWAWILQYEPHNLSQSQLQVLFLLTI